MNFWIDALSTGVVLGTPLAYAALGELIAERAGVVNLGVEGMMLMGAVVGFVVGVNTGSVLLAFLCGALAGGAMAAIHSVVTVTLRANQIVMGLTLTILGTGLSDYIGNNYGSRQLRHTLGSLNIPGFDRIPWIGKILFQQDIVIYLAPVAIVIAAVVIARTRPGLWLRAAGESPGAADAAGVPIFAVRHAAVVLGGLLAGIGGAYLSIAYTRSWSDQMTSGDGFIAIALVVFASWRPLLLIPGALLFGFIDALNFQLQSQGVSIPNQYLSMMPYVFTLVVLTIVWTRQRKRNWGMPQALGSAYEREART